MTLQFDSKENKKINGFHAASKDRQTGLFEKSMQNFSPDQTTFYSDIHAGTGSLFQHDFSRVQVQTSLPVSPQRSQTTSCPMAPRTCPFGGICHTCPVQVQTKLTISQPGDKYEQEAERVAEQVLSLPVSASLPHEASHPTGPGAVQNLQQLATTQTSTNAVPPVVTEVLSSEGYPLEAGTRAIMEPLFDHDFSGVRVHSDAQAANSARILQAKAYTSGYDIVFASGQYMPNERAGRQLLAHELAHTIQQGSTSGTQIQCKPEEDLSEQAEELEPDDELLPEPSDTETFVVGNTLEMVTSNSPADLLLDSPEGVPKAPTEKGKTKMGGPLGPVELGLGQPATKLSPTCASWIKLNRTTYPYDPSKGADPMEKELIETYKGFKEAVPIAKPSDFNKKLKATAKNPCTCIENLSIDGHGASWSGGGQEFAPRKFKALGKRSFGVKKTKSGKIKPYNFSIFDGIQFCKPCAITLGGCYVALNKPKAEAGTSGFTGAGTALGNALAAKTGCSVKAYTGTTTTPKAGEFKGKAGGKWVTTKPKETGETGK